MKVNTEKVRETLSKLEKEKEKERKRRPECRQRNIEKVREEIERLN